MPIIIIGFMILWIKMIEPESFGIKCWREHNEMKEEEKNSRSHSHYYDLTS